ncbi:hypothetical protein Patl1_34428 [Pistacia atlantica]|uniref:Uncharacterized protein n=1 Tax=Pistacia atlantica TaxID=434234 RepID=A0ACC0ZRK5_9ROSI|nr:hypothetical protein Patl1_34428 [Pistacia atlantica]
MSALFAIMSVCDPFDSTRCLDSGTTHQVTTYISALSSPQPHSHTSSIVVENGCLLPSIVVLITHPRRHSGVVAFLSLSQPLLESWLLGLYCVFSLVSHEDTFPGVAIDSSSPPSTNSFQ